MEDQFRNKQLKTYGKKFALLVLFLTFFLSIGSTQLSRASSDIIVNTTLDEKKSNDGLCSLREAVLAANSDSPSGSRSGECNAGSGADTIILAADTYLLTKTDNGQEDASQTGDLDIDGDLTIMGQGASETIIAGELNEFSDRLIHVLNGQVTIQGVKLTQGNVPGDGGALANSGSLELINVVMDNNHAEGSGGGLYNEGSLTAVNVAIIHNTASGGAGGGAFLAAGSADFTNTTFSNNSANGVGGALANEADTALSFVTIAENTAVSASGLHTIGNLSLDNTSVSGSCSGTLSSGGHNLIETTAGCTINGTTTGNLLNQNPKLDPLTEIAGTFVHPLQFDSPAVEAGDNTDCPSTDQRGTDRPRGLFCDIGAYELENPRQTGEILVVNTADDVDDVDDGVCDFVHCSLREAINWANMSSISDEIHFAISGDNPPVIMPMSELPAVIEPLVIDGTTQTGGLVVLDGSMAGDANGLVIIAGGSEIRGLRIVNFSANGLLLQQNGGNLIENNEIAHNGGDGIRIAEGTENTLSANDIHDNTGLGIDLGGDGHTQNDVGDPDDGANQIQNYPKLILAVPDETGSSLSIYGRLNSNENSDYHLEFFATDFCHEFGGGNQTYLGDTQVTTDANGNTYFTAAGLTAVEEGHFVTATVTDINGNTSEFADCISVSPGNTAWWTAQRLYVVPDMDPIVVDHFLDMPGQSRWYKFSVQPGSKIIVTLTDLPDNYDLTIYKDILQTEESSNTSLELQNLPKLDAEFAADAFSPEVFSPEVFSPEAYSPEVFSPEVFSPEVFSPEVFSPEVFSPEVFSPEVFSPEVFSADAYSPEVFSPEVFSPEVFSPEVFSPEVFSPEVFSSAPLRSLIGASAFRGTANEGIVLNVWNNTGDFYIRVRGANGAHSTESSFHLAVSALSENCGGVTEVTTPTSLLPEAGGYETIILTDMARMAGSTGEKETLQANLVENFKDRPEVVGVVVDVGADARVLAANAQADAHPACPYAKNLVADAIESVVDSYWAVNPLQYVVIVGNDHTIPFRRYPDNALLANESNYVPPVKDSSASQASLRLGYILGQDSYGSRSDFSYKSSVIPLAELPVGRLVETAVEANSVLTAYLSTTDGVVPLSNSPLVTGYDFLEDVALAVQSELEAGTGLTADTLIAEQYIAPADPQSWTADDLRGQLLGSRHDLIFLAGHFSAGGALAADYTSRMTADELLDPGLDLQNVIIFSAGCHAGYNTVNEHAIPGVTDTPDWAQAFASKGALLFAGTGYQYGDTDFLEYSERLYLNFSQELRRGSGSVSAGQAMVAAKQRYLAETPQMRGIHEKALIEAALFGLPHLSVDMTGERLPEVGSSTDIGSVTAMPDGPGSVLGLATADYTLTPDLSPQSVILDNVVEGGAITATYYAGKDGVLTNPAEPTLPLELINAGVDGTSLRGVGFRGGSYEDLPGIVPFTGAPTTEIRGVHAPFPSDVYYPIQFWRTNYFDQLTNPTNGSPTLAVTPAQFKSTTPGVSHGTLRLFDSLNFRLFYSNNVTTYTSGSVPALSAPLHIVQVVTEPGTDSVHFEVDVVGNPAAGIQAVWVVFTAVNGSYHGQWQPLDLTPHPQISSRWQGDLPLNGTNPEDMRYLVQAVNGVGLVSLAANSGDMYVPGQEQHQSAETLLEIINPPSSGVYGSQTEVSVKLTSDGQPLVGEQISVGIGPQSRQAITDEAGEASVLLTLLGLPGDYQIRVSFGGTDMFAPAANAVGFSIQKQNTILSLSPQPAAGFPEDDLLLTATLTDANGQYLNEKTVFFVIHGLGDSYSRAVITDFAGRAYLGDIPLPNNPVPYTVDVYFSGVIPLQTNESMTTLTLTDARYQPAATSGELTLLNHAPQTVADVYSTDEDTTLLVAAPGVLANDIDAEADGLTAVLETSPTNGTLALQPDGSFSYTPDENFNGSDSFSYRVSDGTAVGDVAAVSITVNPVNDAPTAVAEAYEVNENESLTVDVPGVLANDSDVEGDALTAVLTQAPEHGILALNSDGSFSYVPAPDYYGSDSFAYVANDGSEDSNEVVVSLTVLMVNNAPLCGEAVASPYYVWPANGEFYAVSISGISDPDEDTYTLVVTGIFQDEDPGKGNKGIDGRGLGTDTAEIRAERDGNGNGRVYHIFFTVTDSFGATCEYSVRVPIVPHDQAGEVEIDDAAIDLIDEGPIFDSTSP